MAEIKRQKLIHLHKSTALDASAAAAVAMAKGEIAVRHADNNADSALYTLNNNGDIVTFPSVEKVTSLISGATSDNISTLQNKVKELEGTVSGYSSTDTVKKAVDGVQSSLQGQIDTINGKIGSGFTSGSTIASQLAAVKNTADNAKTQATTNKNSIDTINSVLKGLSGESAVSNAINKAKTKVVATDTATTKFLTVSDNSATNPASGVTYTLTLKDVASAKGLSDLSTKVGTNETDITALKGLHADNEDKSGKLTVAEEVAVGIAGVIAGAPDKFDTLKEIADWIASDTTNSTQMVNDIADLKATLTGYDKTNTVQKAISTVNGDITTINNKIGGDFSSANTVADAIAAAKTTITPKSDGFIHITSATTDGHLNYTITETNIASNSDLSALSTKVTTLQGSLDTEVTNRTNGDNEIKGLIGTGFTADKTVAMAVAAAKTKVAADTGTNTTNFLELSNDGDTNPANGVTYTIKLKDVASANDLSTLKSAAAKSGKITVDSQEFKATSVDATNSLNFDLSNLVIDCGTY